MPLVAGLIYALFTLFYYLAGGKDPEGYSYIYEVMDWSKPGMVITVIFGVMILIILLHTFMFWLYRLRVRLFNQYFVKKEEISTTSDRGETNPTFKSDSIENITENGQGTSNHM